MADGYLNFDTKINEKGFNDGISKLGSLGKSGLSIVSKAMTGAIAAVGTGAAAIIKSSLGVVANMEQQVGGVETLFKDSANTVIANANKAYKTAGMSANNYMETVTSFSASLLQSLGGDTAKAASYADRAIVDMSDNANKMGTNMRDIQNAYQGFAKQNYTMLDNLKLGYGGTQEEMKRLISDASKMTDVQKELGVTVDASSLSFGNIVNAISVVQKQMGITGTTSKEAATTIEGSVNSAKAAWENFEAGVISANDLVETFWTAAQNIFTNLGQIIPRLGKTGMDVVSALAGKIGGAVPQVKGFTDSISKLANELKGMNSDQLLNLGKMAVVIAGSAPALSIFGKGIENVKTATDGFNDIVDGVVTSIGKVPKGAKSASATFKKIGGEFKYLSESIALPFQDLGEKIASRLKDLGGFMAESWANGPGGKITGAVTNTVKKIGGAFGQIGPKLAEKFPGVAEKFAELGTKMSAVSAKASKVLGKAGTKISEYAGFIADAFTPILSRVASFAPTFFKLINIGAGAAIIVAGMGLIYSQFGTQIVVHMKSIGNKEYKNITKDTLIGTTGQNRRLEAIRITGKKSFYLYRVHQKSIGWSEWANNGEWAGTTGKGLQMEALEIKKSMFSVEPHVQSKGWLSPKAAENVIGITGHALRLEAIRINPYGKTIKAKVHIQSKGWVDYGMITEDTIIGTVGEKKRIECLCFEGDFEYRVHIQSSGWTDWTKADGVATLGTVGQELRIEAIQFR